MMLPAATLESRPSIREELGRKAFDQLERLVRHRDQGKITDAQFSVALDTLFNTCSGLVDNDFFEAISACQVIKPSNIVESWSFVHHKNARFAEIKRDKDSVLVKLGTWVDGKWKKDFAHKDFKDEIVPSQSAKDYCELVRMKLEASGFVEM